ncbi:helix-turn-helix transcriptional regulator [Streptomyces sp. NPDC086077]|uniref:helix-turn-helix domain-containing protein n=1 Tax=Streptomyces sp. NPDC086077 TaxID=3154862 RepID=UPI0034353024
MEDQNAKGQAKGTPSMEDALGFHSPEELVGQRVKQFREIRGWSQRDLAQRMLDQGHSWRQTTVAKTEAADRPIRVNELHELANVLGVTVVDLMTMPLDDEFAELTVRLGELQVRQTVARQRLADAKRAKDRAASDLTDAQQELDEVEQEVQSCWEAIRQHKGNASGEQEHQEEAER